MTLELTDLSADDFSAYLNNELVIDFTPEDKQKAVLTEVKEGAQFETSARKSFSIILTTEKKESYYNQGIYILQHPTKGNLEIFFVPLGPDEKGMRYQAIFS